MLKSLLMAGAMTLAFSGTAMADDVASSGAAGCSNCGVSSTSATSSGTAVQAAMQTAGRAAAVRGDWEQPKENRICCDPKLNNISFSDYYKDDTNDVHAGTYGIVFNTSNPNYTTVFQPAMNNTATMAGILGPVNNGWLFVMGEMKTDNDDLQAFDSTATPSQDFWNAATTTTTVVPSTLVYADPVIPTNPAAGFPWGTAFSEATLGGSHMLRNGTRYAVKFRFYHWYYQNGWHVVEVFCRDSKDHYLGRIKSDVGAKISQGSSGGNSLAIADQGASRSSQVVRAGPPRRVSPAEIAALPAEVRAKLDSQR